MSEKLIDFVAKRNNNIEQKRRQFERVVFNNFLGCYSVIDDNGAIFSVSLIDISEEGCMFQVPHTKGSDKQFAKDADITLRLYFTKDSFIPAVVKIRHANEHYEKGVEYVRYGCQFDKSVPTYQALKSFVEFIAKFAEHSIIDRGTSKVIFYKV